MKKHNIVMIVLAVMVMTSGCVTGKDGKPLSFDSLATAFNQAPFGFDGSVEKVRLAQDWLGPLTKYTSTDKTIPELDQNFRTPPVGRRPLTMLGGDAVVSLWSERDAEGEITLIVSAYPEKDKTPASDVIWRPLRVKKGQLGKLEPVLLTDEQAQTVLAADNDYKESMAEIAAIQAKREALDAKRKAAAAAEAKRQADAKKAAAKKKATPVKAKAPVAEKATEPVAVPVPEMVVEVEEPMKSENQDPAPAPPAAIVEPEPVPEVEAQVAEKATETPAPEPVAAPVPTPEAPKSFLD